MFRDPTGGKDGQEGVGPGGVGAVGAVCGGVRVVAEVTVVFAFGGGRPAVSVRSAQPLASSARGSASGELTGEQAERFAAARRAAGLASWASPQSVTLPLGYLRTLGVAPVPAPVLAQGPLEELLEDYRRYLSVERGSRVLTRCSMRMDRPPGCSWPGGRAPMGWAWSGCRAADVSSFLARECPKRSVPGARDLVCALRSLVALPAPGGTDRRAAGVGGPVGCRSAGSHAAARPGARGGARSCWPAVTGARLVGRRDFAILLLLSRLGLRAGEVAGLRLDDVDWRRGRAARSRQGRPSRCAAVARRCRRGGRVLSSPPPSLRVPGAVLAGHRATPGTEPQHDRVGGPRRLRPGRAGQSRRPPSAPYAPRPGCSGRARRSARSARCLRHREQKTTAIYAKVDRIALRGSCARGRRQEVRHDHARRIAGRLSAASAAGSGFEMPQDGRLLEGFVEFLDQAGAAPDHDRAGAGVGEAARGRPPTPLASAALRGPRVRPLSGDDRPYKRGSLHGFAARASPADRALHLHRRRDRER